MAVINFITDTQLQGCHMGTSLPSGSMLVLPAAEPNQPVLIMTSGAAAVTALLNAHF